MGVFTAITREVEFMSAMLRVLGQIKKVGPASGLRVPDHIEKTVDRFADRPMALTDEGEVSYARFEAYANRVAHWALEQGMKPGETVALFMSNRWEYIAVWFGLSKVGLVTSLINNQLQGKKPISRPRPAAVSRHKPGALMANLPARAISTRRCSARVISGLIRPCGHRSSLQSRC